MAEQTIRTIQEIAARWLSSVEDEPHAHFDAELEYCEDSLAEACATFLADRVKPGFRRFVLDRGVDVTGVSGTGIVAEGVLFENGVACVQWLSDFPTSVVFHQRGMESIDAVHGHHGQTRIVFLDGEGE